MSIASGRRPCGLAAARDLPRAGQVGCGRRPRPIRRSPIGAARDAPAAVGELLEAVLVVEVRVAPPSGLERVGERRRRRAARSASRRCTRRRGRRVELLVDPRRAARPVERDLHLLLAERLGAGRARARDRRRCGRRAASPRRSAGWTVSPLTSSTPSREVLARAPQRVARCSTPRAFGVEDRLAAAGRGAPRAPRGARRRRSAAKPVTITTSSSPTAAKFAERDVEDRAPRRPAAASWAGPGQRPEPPAGARREHDRLHVTVRAHGTTVLSWRLDLDERREDREKAGRVGLRHRNAQSAGLSPGHGSRCPGADGAPARALHRRLERRDAGPRGHRAHVRRRRRRSDLRPSLAARASPPAEHRDRPHDGRPGVLHRRRRLDGHGCARGRPRRVRALGTRAGRGPRLAAQPSPPSELVVLWRRIFGHGRLVAGSEWQGARRVLRRERERARRTSARSSSSAAGSCRSAGRCSTTSGSTRSSRAMPSRRTSTSRIGSGSAATSSCRRRGQGRTICGRARSGCRRTTSSACGSRTSSISTERTCRKRLQNRAALWWALAGTFVLNTGKVVQTRDPGWVTGLVVGAWEQARGRGLIDPAAEGRKAAE